MKIIKHLIDFIHPLNYHSFLIHPVPPCFGLGVGASLPSSSPSTDPDMALRASDPLLRTELPSSGTTSAPSPTSTSAVSKRSCLLTSATASPSSGHDMPERRILFSRTIALREAWSILEAWLSWKTTSPPCSTFSENLRALFIRSSDKLEAANLRP